MNLTSRMTVITAAVIAFASVMPADAGAHLYAGRRKTINCGVVVIDRAKQPLAEVGNLFFLLDRRTDLKPAGWSFDNPLAPYSASTGQGKDNPAYWEVDLTTATNLSRMHVLYFPASGTLKLTDQQREALRRFVDGGGVLWVDNSGTPGGALTFDDSFFLTNFSFNNANGRDVPTDRHHPLLSTPYWINEMEVGGLGANPGRYDCMPGYDPGVSWGMMDRPTSFDILFTVVKNTGTDRPSVAANAYGSGRIVATANYVGKGCYAYYPYEQPNLKFAYNVMAWASSFTALRKDPRHSGASIDTVGGAKLLEHWSLPDAPPNRGAESSPVIHKNVVFYSSGNTLFALDVFPSEDLDQDGNPDDGLPDNKAAPKYKGADIIWTWEGDGELSSPTVASAQDPVSGESAIEAVLVTSSAGAIHMLEAFPVDSSGRLAGQTRPIVPPYTKVPPTGQLNPPLYINGWVYALGGDGRMYAWNPALQAWNAAGANRNARYEWNVPTEFGLPGEASSGRADPRRGPHYGFVKNDSSGAVVGMVYWFAGPWETAGAMRAERNDFVYGVPVYVSNDRLKPKRTSSVLPDTECDINYRSGNISADPPPIVWIRLPTGVNQYQTVNADDLNKTLLGVNSPGTIILRGVTLEPGAMVYASYALDYAPMQAHVLQMALPRVRAPLKPSSRDLGAGGGAATPPTEITGTPAMGPSNMLYINAKRSGVGGSVYGILNDGTRQVTRWNYVLHPEISGLPEIGDGWSKFLQPLRAGDPTFPDLFGVITMRDSAGNIVSMQDPQVKSSPAVSGDKVFVTVSGADGSGALVCFKANPDFTIRIMENAGYDEGGKPIKRPKSLYNRTTRQNARVRVWQPNLMLGGGTPADMQPMLSAVDITRAEWIDYDRGAITFHDFDTYEIRGTGPNANVTSTFTPSLPVWVYVDNVAVPIDMNTWGPAAALAKQLGMVIPPETGDCVDLSGWNNLLWYYAIPDSTISSSPVVIGNKVYFIADNGFLYALNADTGESLGGAVDAKNVVWQHDLGDGPLGGQDTNLSVAGANGVLVTAGANGLHAFTNATTLVADNNRLVELDGAGEIAWSVDTLTWPSAVPPANAAPPRRTGQINKPARVRYLAGNELLVVNSGANQVARIDRSGTVGIAAFSAGPSPKFIRWMYDKFADPKNLLRTGQPTQLQGPTDALLWEEIEPDAGGPLLVVHCLVADSGNHRILDLVYRIANGQLLNDVFDPASGYVLPELNWVTKTDSMNQRYVYDCIQLVPESGGAKYSVWAAVSNYATGTDLGGTPPVGNQGLGGAIVALGYRKREKPADPWIYSGPGAGEIVARCDRTVWPGGGERPLAVPRFFQVLDKYDPQGNMARFLLICDNYGVYKARIPAGGPPVVEHALRDDSYRRSERELIWEQDGDVVVCEEGLGAPLVATSVQELPNGNWLIANGYSGNDKMSIPAAGMSFPGAPNRFSGEVFEYEPSSGRIVWNSPALYTPKAPPNMNPPAPDTGIRRQKLSNSYIMEQPRSALRQF